jgi:hypothetical protein
LIQAGLVKTLQKSIASGGGLAVLRDGNKWMFNEETSKAQSHEPQ